MRPGAVRGRGDEFIPSEEELREAEVEFEAACRAYAANEYEAEMRYFRENRDRFLRGTRERLDKLRSEEISARRPARPGLPPPPPAGEVEDECRAGADAIIERLAAGDARPSYVRILDCTLRDGIAPLRGVLSQDEKVWLARQIAGLGVDVLEVGVAWNADDLEVIRRVARALGRGVTVAGLVQCRPRRDETRRVVDALRDAFMAAGTFAPGPIVGGCDCPPRIHLFLETSEALRASTSQITDPSEVVALAAGSVAYARECGFADIELSAMDATRTDFGLLVRVFREALAAGARTVNLADTAGWATPQSIGRLVGRLLDALPDLGEGRATLSVHCHNVLGMATANCVAACVAGARQVECTVNGIGPRGGNAPLEEVAMALKVRSDLMGLKTGVQTRLLTPVSRVVETKTGIPVPAGKPIVGRYAAEEVLGVDLPDVRSDDVRVFASETVGAEPRLVVGPEFGRKVLRAWLKDLGLPELPPGEIDRLYHRLRALSQVKRQVGPEDLIALVAEPESPADASGWALIGLTATTTGVDRAPVASVRLRHPRDGQVVEEAATGTGPVAAVFTAINRATGVLARVRDYRVRMVTADISSQAEVSLELEDELDETTPRRPYHGLAVSQDLVLASTRAYLDAINHIDRDRRRPARPSLPAPRSAATPPRDADDELDRDEAGPAVQILPFDPTVRRNRA